MADPSLRPPQWADATIGFSVDEGILDADGWRSLQTTARVWHHTIGGTTKLRIVVHHHEIACTWCRGGTNSTIAQPATVQTIAEAVARHCSSATHSRLAGFVSRGNMFESSRSRLRVASVWSCVVLASVWS